MSNSFDPVILPPGYAYGFSGGPAFDTRIVPMDGGGEQRVQVREEPIWRWSATRKNFRDGADVDGVIKWFLARHGAQYGWLFIDPRDYTTNADGTSAPTPVDQVIGFGDGVTTRFRLRKQSTDPGGMTARTFPRRVVPLTGTATAPMARLFGIAPGDSIAPAAAVDGATDGGAVFFPMSQEVQFSSPPSFGAQATWGGYLATVVRFSEATDKGLEATISGFQSDDVAIEIESLPFDDPVPLVPGGSPYGYVNLVHQSSNFELSGRRAFFWQIEADATITGYLDDLDNYPTGGPHAFIQNTGAFTITLADSLGASVGGVAAGSGAWLLVKEDASGNRTPSIWS